MFADSLLEVSWAERGRRSWMTLTSFGLQAVIIGLLLMIPLLTTVGSPLARTVSTPITMGRRSPRPATQPHDSTVRNTSVPVVAYNGQIRAPGQMPHGIPKDDGNTTIADYSDEPPQIGTGSYGGGGDTGLPFSIGGNRPVALPPAPKVEKVFRTSTILQGMLIRKVEPKYPPLAISARIQGPVVLAASISKAGTIDNLRLISGHPLLVAAAIDAVSQWRYRPYILNGDVIEVDTQITVNFVLGQ